MDNTVRPSTEQYRAVYEDGFQRWETLRQNAFPLHDLASFCRSALLSAFPRHPYFPPGLQIYNNYGCCCTHASSSWETSQGCQRRLPALTLPLTVNVSTKSPTTVSLGSPNNKDATTIAALFLAWTYLLSARWAEIFNPEPGAGQEGQHWRCALEYTTNQRDVVTEEVDAKQSASVSIDIGDDATPAEVRWWSALLASTQGWRASITLGETTTLSPWSVSLQDTTFRLVCRSPQIRQKPGTSLDAPPTPPSFFEALQYLDRFCQWNGIASHSRLALAAALVLPSTPTVTYGRKLVVLAECISNSASFLETSKDTEDWSQHMEQFDRLLTVSCYIQGIRPVLLGVFYEPTIECHTVSAWLQGVSAALDVALGQDQTVPVVADGEPFILARMLMGRSPEAALLWLGVSVLGLQQAYLLGMSSGLVPANLHSAVWSGTVQSFMQEPVTFPLVSLPGSGAGIGGNGSSNGTAARVSRADECRLHYLAQSKNHTRFPIGQWKPFGSTALSDTDLEVRVHADCGGRHGLQYTGITWNGVGGMSHTQNIVADKWHAITGDNCDHKLSLKGPQAAKSIVSYARLDEEKEDASANETRKIFDWLRVHGCSGSEKDIWAHEWFKTWSSDDEDEYDEDEDYGEITEINKRNRGVERVFGWLFKLEQAL